MLGHCVRRYPNVNSTLGLNASCFLTDTVTLVLQIIETIVQKAVKTPNFAH